MRYTAILGNCSFSPISADYEKILIAPSGYVFTNAFSDKVKVFPLRFEERIQEYKAFASAYNRQYRFSGPALELKPVKIGKSDFVYVNPICCFDKEKEPLYIRLFTATEKKPTIILSPKAIFSDNIWLTNMIRKVFNYIYNHSDGANMILDEGLLKSCFVSPAVPKHPLSIDDDVKKFFEDDDMITYALSIYDG